MNGHPMQPASTGTLTAKVLLAALVGLAGSQAHAVAVTILFDLVKVTTAAGAGADAGFNLYSVKPIGDGPYKTKDGAAELVFFKQKPNGDMRTFLNGFTGAGIFANQFDLRYFGSVSAPKGSILRNFTNVKFIPKADPPGFDTQAVAGKAISGFKIKVAQPTQDNIATADGGNAFPTVAPADDKAGNKTRREVTFSGGNIPVGDFPTVGNSGNFLWSFISPTGDQPKFPQVMFTDPTIPPDPAGEFKNIKFVGMATAVPEPSTLVLMVGGLGWIGLVGRRRARGR